MTGKKKKAPAWRAGFLRALGRLGNVRAAASEAGVDCSTAYNHRKRDAGFAEEWAKALAAAGSETAVAVPAYDQVLRYSKKHGAQLVKAAPGRWSQRAEQVFLSHLRATGCIRRAAEAAGFSTTAVDYRRGRYPAFAARWDAAVEEAKVRLHSLVVAAGIAAFDPGGAVGDVPKVSAAEAIAILRLKGAPGAAPPARDVPPEPSIEAVRDEIRERLAAIRRHRGSGR
jgi:hypothetical protein